MAYQYIPDGTITSPKGFLAGATLANIRSRETKSFDLAILQSEFPCTVAGVFTTNLIKAAPVILCQEHLKKRKAQAIIANSGCANTCTGEQGFADAERMASLTAEKMELEAENVMVASTGVIGTRLPMDRIEGGIRQIELSPEGGHQLAQAIMSTDTVSKEVAVPVGVGEDIVTVGGIAKGAGMIHPNMATMLCFLTTDANIDPDFLQVALARATENSFNMITVDGDTSPNDMVLILANGLANNPVIVNNSRHAEIFQSVLDEVCLYLAKCIARDGEGASKLIEVTVEGGASHEDAKRIARTIAGSPLVKTAVRGSDPNWGRVVAAAGRSGAEVMGSKIDLYLDNLCLVKGGCALPFNVQDARAIMSRDEVPFRLCLNLGLGKATAWGCDLTEEYVILNSEYTT